MLKNESNTNKKFDDLNDSIGIWKRNINTALDKIKLDHEDNVKKVIVVILMAIGFWFVVY